MMNPSGIDCYSSPNVGDVYGERGEENQDK